MNQAIAEQIAVILLKEADKIPFAQRIAWLKERGVEFTSYGIKIEVAQT
jgi:Tfp pilus assembly protein PilZ